MKKYISFSGGVESTTMCILYGADATAIWSDTGSEHEKMYERIDTVESEIKKIHPNFTIIRLKPTAKHKGEYYDTLEGLATAYKYMPSGQSRYCTRIFKIEPIDNYLKQVGECELMIGLNADEANSRDGNWGLNKNVHYRYPLVEDDYTRAECEEILHQYNLHPNMPVYMMRGGCRMCFFKTEKEYKAMYFLSRKEFDDVMQFEQDIQDKRGKFYSIMANEKSLRQLALECEQERSFLVDTDWEEIYKSKKNQKSCGAFCHR